MIRPRGRETAMTYRKSRIALLFILLGFTSLFFPACRDKDASVPDQAWLDSVFARGKVLFYQTIRDELAARPDSAGHTFVETFFQTDFATDLARKSKPEYKDLDAVDLVVRSVGYGAKLDLPPQREFFKDPASPRSKK